MEMVVFVLDGAGEQAATTETDDLALAVRRGDVDGFGAWNIGVNFWETQAAFGSFDGIVYRLPFGIDEDEWHDGSGVGRLAVEFESAGALDDFADVDDGELKRFADLLRSEADALRVIHRFEHIVDELLDFWRNFLDPLAFLAEDRMPVLNHR